MDYGDMRGGGCSASGLSMRPPAAAAFSFVDVLHTVLFSHILYSTRKVSLRGRRGSCRGCWRKSRRRRRRSHSW